MFLVSPEKCINELVWTGPGVVGIATCPSLLPFETIEPHVFTQAQVVSLKKEM